MNVLVIPEDFRKDQYILRPILEAMFTKLGKPAIVSVLMDPLIGGIDQALNRQLLQQVVEDNKWYVDLFLLCVDRDGESSRRHTLDDLEQHVNTLLGAPKFMIAENAWQELEVWYSRATIFHRIGIGRRSAVNAIPRKFISRNLLRLANCKMIPAGGGRRWVTKPREDTAGFYPGAGKIFRSWNAGLRELSAAARS